MEGDAWAVPGCESDDYRPEPQASFGEEGFCGAKQTQCHVRGWEEVGGAGGRGLPFKRKMASAAGSPKSMLTTSLEHTICWQVARVRRAAHHLPGKLPPTEGEHSKWSQPRMRPIPSSLADRGADKPPRTVRQQTPPDSVDQLLAEAQAVMASTEFDNVGDDFKS